MEVMIKSIEKMFRAMSDRERLATVSMINDVCGELGLKEKPESSTSPRVKLSGWKKKRPRGASAKSFWMRTAKAIDMSKKGMFQIEGEWVNNLAKDCEFGQLIVLGIKGDEKQYHLLTRATAGSFSFVDSGGNTVLVEGCEEVYNTDRYGELITKVKELLVHA